MVNILQHCCKFIGKIISVLRSSSNINLRKILHELHDRRVSSAQMLRFVLVIYYSLCYLTSLGNPKYIVDCAGFGHVEMLGGWHIPFSQT